MAENTIQRRVEPANDLMEFADGGASRDGMIEVATTRAAQEVQAAMIIAKKCPRNEQAAYQRIMDACKRRTLAEAAVYEFPRGKDEETGQKNFVTGPSIRLAEVLARAWGNIDFGIVELEQRDGESTMMSYAWDLETNTRQTKIFTVRHIRHSRRYGNTTLTDPRDIYEMTANQGARRLRKCILGIIPGDVVDAAVEACEKTMAGSNNEPIVDRVRKMIAAFDEIGVNRQMIETSIGHTSDEITERELQRLRRVYRTVKDNVAAIDEFFPRPEQPSQKAADLSQAFSKPAGEKASPEKAPVK